MEVNNELSEKALQDYNAVRRVIDGSIRAREELFEKYQNATYHIILRIVKNQSDAEALTINVFGKTLQNLKYYTPLFNFSTWLFKTAASNAIEFMQEKKQTIV